jgi:general secretion pathway protein E
MLTTVDPKLASHTFLQKVPRDFARDHGLLSQGQEDAGEIVAICADTNPMVLWNIGILLARPVRGLEVDRESLMRAIDAAYEQHREQVSPKEAALPEIHGEKEDLDALLAAADRDLLSSGGKAPVVRLLDQLLFSAVSAGASDIHLQPTVDHLLVRQRIDGILDNGQPLPLSLSRPLLSRVKVIGRMDVAERLTPQDGRTSLRIGERTVDVRISTIPTSFGERAVMRLLDTKQQLLSMTHTGMPEHVRLPFLGAAKRSSGIVLVTGPTGSGKTTTLYATLRSLDAIERNVMTIEDPIEYELASSGIPISQSQVNPRKGISFANGLRHILRQDPDIIMVGEIRDPETARMAIQASLTGHLVFSTLHTNDAASAITRLIDLGVEPFLVSASLTTVLAQRLARKLCPTCLGKNLAQDQRCETCLGSGFKGRIGIFELLQVTPTIRSLITQGADAQQLKEAAQKDGMLTLVDEGQRLVRNGITTSAEVDRVIHHG